MECETKLWLVVFFFLSSATYCVVGQPQVPCFFIFGDSLSDSGNNNYLKTDAKVDHKPYGCDFPAGPTGRFTNGRTAADIITELLGFDHYIPPYANTAGSDIAQGVNYASGAAGIRQETGTHLGQDISMGQQVQNHKDIVTQITTKLGAEKVQEHLNKCLYYVNIGSNDYLNNYFLPQHYPSNKQFNPDQYAKALVTEHATYLKGLYGLGARKFALFGLGALGCIPHEIETHGKNGSLCVEEESKAAQLFNDKLKALVDRYNKELVGAKFTLLNAGASSGANTNSNVSQAGLTDIVKCCKVGANGQCIPNEEPCIDRNIHPFFDSFHPTENVNKIMAITAFHAPNPASAYPLDISNLIML